VARELTYLDFDVLMERGDQGAHRARVVNAPAGETPPIAFTVPFTAQDLEMFMLRIGRPRRVVRTLDAPETKAIKTFGGQLYRALFHDDLEVSLLRSLSEAAARRTGLRIRLRLSDTPELAELPWEFLYDASRNRFLCLSHRTPLVRFLEVPDPPRPLAISPPLQVLVMIASPSDYPQLDVEQEWNKVQGALAPLEQAGQVHLTRSETATLAALRRQLRRTDLHVLHFVGHGGFDPQAQDGVLAFEDQTGRARLVSGQDLGVLLHDHDPLRLVVLNACEGARTDPTDPFAGTAQSLIQQGIPAVVAMQFEITDPAAISLASELYAAIADGYPLDAALAEARKAIWADGNQIEWATPVLHLRAPDGLIFDVTSTPAAGSPPATAASTPMARAAAPPGKTSHPEPTVVAGTAATTTPASARPDSGWSSTHIRTFQHPSKWGLLGSKAVVDVAVSPDGCWLATASQDKTARIWDAHTGQQLYTLGHNNWVWAVAFSSDGRWLATATQDGTAQIWDAHTGQQLHTLGHTSRVNAVAFSSDGCWLATASQDKAARIWDAHTGQQLHTLGHTSRVNAVAFSSDGCWLATGSTDHTARIWDAHTGQQLHTLGHNNWVWAVAFSPDGRWLATGSTDHTARIWDAHTGQQLHTLGHNDSVWAVAFSPDGRWLATGSTDHTARIWDAHTGQQLHTLGHNNWVWAVRFGPDGRWLATGTGGNRAVLWALKPPSRQ
jgi:CHAT domain-containing protein